MKFQAQISPVDENGKFLQKDFEFQIYYASSGEWVVATKIFERFNLKLELRKTRTSLVYSCTSERLKKAELLLIANYRWVENVKSPKSPLTCIINAAVIITQGSEGLSLNFGRFLYLGEKQRFNGGQLKKPIWICGVPLPPQKTHTDEIIGFYYPVKKISEHIKTIDRLQAELAKNQKLSSDLEKNLTQNNALLKSLKSERKNLNSVIEGLRQQVVLKDRALEKINDQKLAHEKTILIKDGRIQEFIETLEDHEAQRLLLNNKKEGLDRELLAKDEKIKALKESNADLSRALQDISTDELTSEKLAVLTSRVSDLTHERDSALSDLKIVREQHSQALKAEDILSNIGRDLSKANERLKLDKLPYKVNKFKINMKAIVTGDGAQMHFPDIATSVEKSPVSEIELEFTQDETPITVEGEFLLPDLTGKTETAVIRDLLSLGLRHNKAIKQTSERSKHGRAISQIPPAGESVSQGRTVKVIYGLY